MALKILLIIWIYHSSKMKFNSGWKNSLDIFRSLLTIFVNFWKVL